MSLTDDELTQGLRKLSLEATEINVGHALRRAADEIERLKGVEAMHEDAEADATTLMAENAALREALERIAEGSECDADQQLCRDDHDRFVCPPIVARKALSQPGPGAAYQERVRKLEVVAKIADKFTDCVAEFGADSPSACDDWLNDLVDALAAMEEKP